MSFKRQTRAHLMVWIALLFLAITTVIVALNTYADRWSMKLWRAESHTGWHFRGVQLGKASQVSNLSVVAAPAQPTAVGYPTPLAGPSAVAAALDAVVCQSGFLVYSSWVVLSLFVSFLLPLWSLSFATEAIGGDRESRTLVWLLTRPLPRYSIYVAKFVALLPWTLGLCLGGFAILGIAAGPPGMLAFRTYWPAVLWGTLAFCAFFQFLGVISSWPAVLAIAYCFFFEVLVANMPGYMKRASLGFYVRCMMFDEAERIGVQVQRSAVYEPTDGTTALITLISVTVFFLVLGAIVFARREFRDAATT